MQPLLSRVLQYPLHHSFHGARVHRSTCFVHTILSLHEALQFKVPSPMRSISCFPYRPLSSRKHQIRLLRLLSPSSGADLDDGVKCSLETVRLDQKVSYRALSYTWGAPDRKSTIFINDAPFQVSKNLFDFLKAFRTRPEANDLIWIDQIAINQDDIPERNSQVAHMKTVYTLAKEVIVWLGPGSAEELCAAAFIQKTAKLWKHDDTRAKLESAETTLLKTFAANPYFHRLWIVQEIILAKALQVLIGDRQLAWDDLSKVYIEYSREIEDGPTSQIANMPAITRLAIAKIDHRGLEPSTTNIEDHLYYFFCQECADPRDKIYGSVGMFFDPSPGPLQRFARRWRKKRGLWSHQDPLFEVDYGKSIANVYFEFCENMLVRSWDAQHTYNILDELGDEMGLPENALNEWADDEIRRDRIEALLND